MRALVYGGCRDLRVRDVPDPVPETGEVLVKVDSVGICGSDMHAYLGQDERRPPPLILGHEAAGTVAAGPLEGRRVSVNPLVTCGSCRDCRTGRTNICARREIISMQPREGAFAEFVRIPERNLVRVPDGVPLEKAALAEPLAVAWHAVRLAGEMPCLDPSDARCLVLGGGAIGLGSALCLRAASAPDVLIAEPNRARRAIVADRARFRTADPEDPAIGAGEWDLVIDAVGSARSRAQACRAVRPGGVIGHIGLHASEGGLDVRRMTLQEVVFFGTYTYTEADFRDAANAMFEGALGSLDWAEARELGEGREAFEDTLGGNIAVPKIILKP